MDCRNNAQMARSWASVVRGKEVEKKVEPVKAPAPKPVVQKPRPLCVDCGKGADMCRRCGSDKMGVYLDGLCAVCLVMETPSEWMCGGYMDAARESTKIPMKCGPCRAKKPWRWVDDKEVVSYRYEPGCFCHPLSKHNVVHIPIYRRVGETPTDPKQREEEAMAAFQKEMKFSGELHEAIEIYTSFFTDKKAAEERLRAVVDAAG